MQWRVHGSPEMLRDFLQVKHLLVREIPLLIWIIHLVLFNFRFEINMATLNNALQNSLT